MPKKKLLTEALVIRMSRDERTIIRKAAHIAKLSESRFLVTAGLLLSDFRTQEELYAALQVGQQLLEERTKAIMQLRRLGNQLEQLQSEQGALNNLDSSEELSRVIDKVTAVVQSLKSSWHAQ